VAAPVGQSLPGMQAEVQNGLMNLRGVGVHAGAVRVDAGLQLHLVGNDAAQNLEAFLDDGRETDQLKFQGRTLAEDAEFLDKITGVMARFKNMLKGFMGGMAFGQVHAQQFGAAEDAGDDVVEFVGHAAGELVERVKLLGLQQAEFCFQSRLFELVAMGDVRDH